MTNQYLIQWSDYTGCMYLDKLKRDCNRMQAEAERKNCEPLLRDLTEKHISDIRNRFSSIEKQEKYYKKKEIRLHLDTDSVLMLIQGLGRIRLKGTLDQFQVSCPYTYTGTMT